ncbi:hypothetical protein AC578_5110 [Pseudocercospora eumusae]|uniref:Uncharacterized protein n=1 Tax=Pseudocercospora eumusae TaxID=321146 RepID=A0A139GY88_9PEZI|nr:hypothetical protein AC578_5110 [Pseudocercospora eumusae]
MQMQHLIIIKSGGERESSNKNNNKQKLIDAVISSSSKRRSIFVLPKKKEAKVSETVGPIRLQLRFQGQVDLVRQIGPAPRPALSGPLHIV